MIRGVAVFLAVAFGFSWLVWELLSRAGYAPGSTDVAALYLLASFGPALGATAARLATRQGFADAGLAPRLKAALPWYLFAWLWPLAAGAVILLLAQVLSLAHVDWSLGSGLAALADARPDAGHLRDLAGSGVLVNAMLMAVPSALILFGEEFGWRGWLQRRLCAGRPGAAAVAVGVIWSLWHLPLNLRGYNFPHDPLLGQIVFTANLIFLSVIFGWLRERSGTIWTVCLAHASTNTVGATLVTLAIGGGQDLFVAYLGALGVVPLGGLALWLAATGRLRRAGGGA